jgi:hypothetical protein
MTSETFLSEKDLESRVTGDAEDDEEFTDASDSHVKGKSSTCTQHIFECNMCTKEFDGSQINADPALGLCSLCNSKSGSYPDFGTNNNVEVPAPVEKESEPVDNNGHEQAPADSSEDQGDFSGSQDFGEDDKDDFQFNFEKLPPRKAIDQIEIEGYTGFKNAKELGDHFLAGKIASDGNTVVVVVGSLGALEFHQSRNPDDYGITGKDSFWRLVVDPYKRAKTLIMYGYDIYDALQTGEKALVGCCMIMNEDGYPMGQILYKIGRTRCSSPRADGFIYDLIDVK